MKLSQLLRYVILITVLVALFTLLCYLGSAPTYMYSGFSIKANQKDMKSTIDYWKNILESSDSEDQRLISQDVLLETLRFMQLNVPEDDPELLKFVSSLIVMPSTLPRNLAASKANNDYSQSGQSMYMDKLLKGKRNGFFVEAGGFDGESLSNSLFFELERNWTGILIEPLPKPFSILRKKNRKCYAINACIAGSKPQVVKFRAFEMLSGRDTEMGESHKRRIQSESNKPPVFFYVPCFSLNTILKALHVHRIDYFSLDVEGGEYDVLKALDLTTINISSFTIEYNGFVKQKNEIINYMSARGYSLVDDDKQDLFMSKSNV